MEHSSPESNSYGHRQKKIPINLFRYEITMTEACGHRGGVAAPGEYNYEMSN